MAAVLACGEGAVLSHGSAAVLWGLLKPTATDRMRSDLERDFSAFAGVMVCPPPR
jgi:hypothetical protein